MESSRPSEKYAGKFMRTIKKMPPHLIFRIAEENDVEIPFELSLYELPKYLFEELSEETRDKIVADYGDAGNVLSHFFAFKEKIPTLEALMEKSNIVLSLKEESDTLEAVPYFDEVEALESTLRIRFHYFKGETTYLDEETKTIKVLRKAHHGVVVFRPGKVLLEVRTAHGSIARKAANRTAIALGLEPPDPLNFRKEEYVTKFLAWIRSLNNARIEFSVREAMSSLTMSARRGGDLRTFSDFQRYLRQGMLRGGHVTARGQRLVKKQFRDVNFRIFFRDCRVYFTTFSDEDDIEFVADALEKITGGYRIEIPERMLEEFFE